MKIISPEIFYKFLITNEGYDNDLSLYAKNNELDSNGNIKEKFNLNISNLSGEWFDNQINLMNTERDDNEEFVGNFQYLSTIIDEQAMFPQYNELFMLQIIGLEKDRERFISFFDEFASEINNFQTEIELDEKVYDIKISLGELSTAEYSDKFDINGSERFVASLSFIINITTNLVTNKKIKLYHVEEGISTPINYTAMKITRGNELSVDTRASEEKSYNVNKSDFTLTLNVLYEQNNSFCKKIMKYAVIGDEAGIMFSILYNDESSKKIEDGETEYEISNAYILIPSAVEVQYQFGLPVSISISLKKLTSLVVGG